MGEYELDTTWIPKLHAGEKPEFPLLQVVGMKEMNSAGNKRIRLLLSDGISTFGSAMLATQLNDRVDSGEISSNCIICIQKYSATVMNGGNKLVVIVFELETRHSGDEVGRKLGGPVPFKASNYDHLPQQKQASNGNHSRAAPAANRSAPQNGSSRPSTATINNPNNSLQQTSNSNGSSGASMQSRPPPNRNNGNNIPQSMQSPKPSRKLPLGSSGTTPTTPGGSATKVMPINILTPYVNRWTIRARVVMKGQIREWKNARGEGKLFNFTVMDDSGDVRITCFNEEADKFMDMIQNDKVYYISNATLKPANKQYNNTTHDYEITLNRNSVIQECESGAAKLAPKLKYNFVPISQLESKVNNFVDIIGVVKEVDDMTNVMIKSQNRETQVRKFLLVDQSNAEVKVTLWGKDATDFQGESNPVVALRSAKVSDFGGCSVSVSQMTVMTLSPDIEEAYKLKQWYEREGHNTATTSMTSMGTGGGGPTNWATLADIKDSGLGKGDKPDYVTAKVTVLYCKKENVLYKACSMEGCNKKVVDVGGGKWSCEKCSKTEESYKHRMILNIHVADEYDSHWVTCFQEQGEILVGMSAEELGELQEQDDPRFESVLSRVDFQSYFMKFRIKAETYNDEKRVRVTAVSVSPVTCSEYSKKLLGDVRALLAEN